MPIPPPHLRKRKPGNAYAGQVLGVRLRTGTTPPRQLTMTGYRATLLHAITQGHIHAKRGTETNPVWRWAQPHGRAITVTVRTNELLAAGWVRRVGPTGLEVTDTGREAMAKAVGDEA